jgi:hypothetical protein
VDAFVVLLLKQRQEYVREVCVTEKREKVQKIDRERVEGYQRPTVLSVTVAARRL